MKPVRIVLSRRAGFDLQATSLALNGRPARSVSRPGRWGNPFSVTFIQNELGIDPAAAQAEAVKRHWRWLHDLIVAEREPPTLAVIRAELAGTNLACWCGAGTPCHADTLIALAND